MRFLLILAPIWGPNMGPKKLGFFENFSIFFQDAPKTPQDVPKSTPKASQEAPRAPKERPKATQECPKTRQERPKSFPTGPNHAPKSKKAENPIEKVRLQAMTQKIESKTLFLPTDL